MLAEEKYRQQQSTAELKNNSREMLNAKGSIAQRKAALERLITLRQVIHSRAWYTIR
ncbi:hypothetical protein [Mucilaginibacter gynuensis]|uniref:hypothetical protein n=1 Tax=Mucilaginibacter gynuensis TaxID=1302236 RepID=UPI0031EEDB62